MVNERDYRNYVTVLKETTVCVFANFRPVALRSGPDMIPLL